MKYLTSFSEMKGKKIKEVIDLLNMGEEIALIFDDETWLLLVIKKNEWGGDEIITIADSQKINIWTKLHAGIITQEKFDEKLKEFDEKFNR